MKARVGDGTCHLYRWPQLYPVSKSELAAGEVAAAPRLTHNASHTPRPLPSWL